MSQIQFLAGPPVLSVAPLRLAVPGRGEDLSVRVSAPVAGRDLPVLLFSHGNGQSLHAYAPLVHPLVQAGFVVIQPTHLDSRLLGLGPDDPRRPQFWRWREGDLIAVLDALERVEAAVPGLAGRIDHGRIAVAGHSWGAQTASMLLGATHPDPDSGATVRIADPRVKAGVLMAVPGTGGANLSAFAAEHLPFMHPDFGAMTAPVLIVAGDADRGAMTLRGPDWWREAYDLAPGPKALLTLFDGEHSLGGIPGFEVRETTDEDPPRVGAAVTLSAAYLRSALYPGDPAWDRALAAFRQEPVPSGAVEVK